MPIQPKDTETILKEFFDPNETFSYNLDRQAVRQALASHLLWAAEEGKPHPVGANDSGQHWLDRVFNKQMEQKRYCKKCRHFLSSASYCPDCGEFLSLAYKPTPEEENMMASMNKWTDVYYDALKSLAQKLIE